MKFDPMVIDDLGAKLYSTLPPVISELVANGYDACAKRVEIELIGTGENKSIIIKDDGIGMDFEDVDNKYLVIGRKRRETDEKKEKSCKRLPIGKKGLGKLAFFGIAKRAQIETVHKNTKIIFEMDWGKIQKSNMVYRPDFKIIENVKEKNGTKITLSEIYRKTDFNIESLKKSISNYFIFDDDFKVFIKENEQELEEIDNEIRYEDGEKDFTWEFPKIVVEQKLDTKYPFAKELTGKIILFKKPVKSSLRGVTLFSRKKLVNLPEFFPVQGSSFFYQYLTGWLEVDFIDEFKPDVIATNRSSLAWGDENLIPLENFLSEIISFIHSDWRKKKAERTKKEIKEKFKIDTETWKDTNRNNPVIIENIKKIEKILDDPEKIQEEEVTDVLGIAHSLAPNNADFVLWSGLHNKITGNRIIKEKYFEGKYLEAAKEAVTIFNEEVQEVSQKHDKDFTNLVSDVFGKGQHKLIWVTNQSNQTEEDIDEGQKYLSMGIMTGFRNPTSHTSLSKAEKKQYFTERNV